MDYPLYGLSPWVMLGFFHLAMAVALWKMAERVKEEPTWYALVPVLNAVLLLKLARKPMWWVILLFLPVVNLVALVVATMSICERFGLNKWWGLAAIVSPANVILYLYIAFSEGPTMPATPKPTEPTAPPVPPASTI